VKTYIACLTPAGTAAIATLAIRGPNAWDVSRELFRPFSPRHPVTPSPRHQGADAPRSPLPDVPEPGRFWLGELGHELADEVVVAVKQMAPVPWVEVHCHGGAEVVRLLIEAFQQKGVQAVSWQELERLTAEPAWRATAAAALVRAPTVRTAAILLDQHHGAFHRAVQAVLAALDRDDPNETGRLLEQLCRYTSVGRHLTEPWRIVIAGAPNVGKSSLVNALAGYQRSIVSTSPGTTRDVVTTLIAVDGWPVELADTAGLRGPAASLEEQGIDRARAAMADADLSAWVLDASTPPVWPAGGSRPPLAERVRFVINKVDLPPAWDLGQAADAMRVSALTGTGLPELCEQLAGWLVPDPPPPGAAVPYTREFSAIVEVARADFVAGRIADVRRKLRSLGEAAE